MSEGVPLTLRTPTLIASTAVTVGLPQRRTGTLWSYELAVEAAAAGASATAIVKVGNNSQCNFLFGTLTATVSTTADADGKFRGYDSINGTAPWSNHRADITAIAGTGTLATVTGGGL